MKLRRLWSARIGGIWGALALGMLTLGTGCRRDALVEVDRNRPPETYITQGTEAPGPGEPAPFLFYRAHIFWRGEDVDGEIAGFRFALDDTTLPSNWTYTTRTDSIFRFPVSDLGTLEHLFLIRAVDNLGKIDATPDTLRFSAFTRTNPQARFLEDRVIVNGELVQISSGDTVAIGSEVKVTWTGSDEDGEVVGWQSLFDTQTVPTIHARDDTTRTLTGLESGTHSIAVSAVDDAGARSRTPARFVVHSNLSTRTRLDPGTFVAWLPRPWRADTLFVSPFDVDGNAVDTIPSYGVVEASWTATDLDSEIISFSWTFGRAQGRTDASVTEASTLLDTNNPNVGLWGSRINFYVRATDEWGQVESPSDSLIGPVGFRPSLQFVNQSEGTFPVEQVHQFRFTANDKDSNPLDLTFQYEFLELGIDSVAGPFDSLAVKAISWRFQVDDIMGGALHRLRARALDNTELAFPSQWDTVEFRLQAPTFEASSDAPEARAGRVPEAPRPRWKS